MAQGASLLFCCLSIISILTTAIKFPSSKNKIPNTYYQPIKWTTTLCEQAFRESRLLPPPDCLQTIENAENAHYQDIGDWIRNRNLLVPNILITGTPRSGTTMFSQLALKFGLELSVDVHYPTKLGTVSWAFAGPNTSHPLMSCTSTRNEKIRSKDKRLKANNPRDGRRLQALSRYRFKYIFHQVRDPLSAIPSLITVVPHWIQCQSEIQKILPNFDFSVDAKEMALQIWVQWNSRLDRFPFIPVHRVEDLNLLDLMASIDSPLRHISDSQYLCAYQSFVRYNTRSLTTQLTWSHILSINQRLGQKAMEMAYAYGYRYHKNSTLVKITPSLSQATIRSSRSAMDLQLLTTNLPDCPSRVRAKKGNWIGASQFNWAEINKSQRVKMLDHPIFVND
jgi:hypothetical protein